MIPRPRRRSLRGAIVALIVAALAMTTAVPAQAASIVAISGSGSTWSQNALDQWRRNVANNYAMTVNFSGTGSSAGRSDFIKGTVDFAVSEIPFQRAPEDGSAPEIPSRGYAYLPIVAGGTSFMYNLKIGGKKVTNLRLSGEVISKIFTGQISNWSDPAIQADNPGLKMPDKGITPVVRSDGSGSTAQFTKWMSDQYPAIWSTGMTSQFPTARVANAKAQNGSLGVAGYVSQNYGEGAITYVEYSYALKSGFPVAKVLNSSGYYIEPTASSVAVALLQAQINTDAGSADYLTQILSGVYNSADQRAYPLSSYSYMIVPTGLGGIFTEDKGYTLGEFTKYVVCEGQQQASALGYSPLPMNLVQAAFAQIARVPGANAGSLNIGSCNNPTFSADGSNKLASDAPYPADCDKQGTGNQCTTGTAGATEGTEVSGSGSGGSAAGAATGGTAASADAATAGGTSTADAVYDANGNLVSGSTAQGGSAVSSPFTLASESWGPSQTGMLVAGVLLLGAILVPPLFVRRSRAKR